MISLALQDQRKRFADPADRPESVINDLPEVPLMTEHVLTPGWTLEQARLPIGDVKHLLAKAAKPTAALAAVYIFGSFFGSKSGHPGTNYFMDAGSMPSKVAQPRITLPQLKISSQVLVGRRDDAGRYSVRWLQDEEIIAAFGFPTRSPCPDSESGAPTLSTCFLPLHSRRTVMATKLQYECIPSVTGVSV